MKIWKFYMLLPVVLMITTNILHVQQAFCSVTGPAGTIASLTTVTLHSPLYNGLNWFNGCIEYSPYNNSITKEICHPTIAADRNRTYGILPVPMNGYATEKSAQPPKSSGATNTKFSAFPTLFVKRHSIEPDKSDTLTFNKNGIDQSTESFQLHITVSNKKIFGRGFAFEKRNILKNNFPVPFDRYAAHQPGQPGNICDKASILPAHSTSLPVSIVSIKAALKNAAVQINWEAREELNLNLYEVERSADGANFQTIGLVFPWENPAASSNYRFMDQHPQSGINFYRLRGVDKDGSFKYSVIVQAGNAPLPVNPVSIVPNPVKGSIRAVFSGLAKASYVVELRTVAGTLQLKKTINIQQADQPEILDPGYAAPGIYWLTIFDQQLQKLGSSRVVIQ